MEKHITAIESLSKEIRGRIIQMSHQARAAHLGSALSCVDILTTLYQRVLNIDPFNPKARGNDRFIMSKGHAVSVLYAVLAAHGFFPENLLEEYASPGSNLEEHPGVDGVPGVEIASGSLGHGLSIGVGMGLCAKIKKLDSKIFVLMSDGECNEGSVWEAAMFAAARKLDNICAIVDFNKWQATGRSCEVMALEPLRKKFEAFGWSCFEVDGHDVKALVELFEKPLFSSGKPVAVVAHTVKGKGVSFMEDDNNWHYRIPTKEEVLLSKKELGLI